MFSASFQDRAGSAISAFPCLGSPVSAFQAFSAFHRVRNSLALIQRALHFPPAFFCAVRIPMQCTVNAFPLLFFALRCSSSSRRDSILRRFCIGIRVAQSSSVHLLPLLHRLKYSTTFSKSRKNFQPPESSPNAFDSNF